MSELDQPMSLQRARRRARNEYEACVAEAMLIVARDPYANIRQHQRDAHTLRSVVAKLDEAIREADG